MQYGLKVPSMRSVWRISAICFVFTCLVLGRWARAAVDHGDTPSTATPVLIGSITSGQLDVSGDLDYFQFTVARAGTYQFYTRGANDIDGYLYDSDWSEITRDTSRSGEEDNFRIVRLLSPGTYYVRVSWGSNGSFGILPLSHGANQIA